VANFWPCRDIKSFLTPLPTPVPSPSSFLPYPSSPFYFTPYPHSPPPPPPPPPLPHPPRSVRIGKLYFDEEKLKEWTRQSQQTMASFEKIRTVGKGRVRILIIY